MSDVNFADLDIGIQDTPPELIGMYPLGGGGLLEAPFRHYFELKHLKKLIQFNTTMNVLELGSGNGRWAVSIAPMVASYTGVDITKRAIDIATSVTKKNNLENVIFHEKSILAFQGDRYYDVIYFSGVSQYLQDNELEQVLRHLRKWFKPTTIIVDRSTVSYSQRKIDQRDNYFSIWRRPQELSYIFKEFGFRLVYINPSYRYLRCGRLFRIKIINNFLIKFFRIFGISFLYALYFFTIICDFLNPISACERGWSHDFILFKVEHNFE